MGKTVRESNILPLASGVSIDPEADLNAGATASAEEVMGEEFVPTPFQARPVTISRRYPHAPMVGTGVAIFEEGGRVLLVKSGKPGRKHPWGLPGGLLDLGEKLADGAKREVWEECQIEIDLGEMIHVFEPVDWDAEGNVEYHFVVVDFWGTYRSGTPTPGDDTVEVAWCAVDALAPYNLMEVSQVVIAKGFAAWKLSRKFVSS